MKCPYCDLPAFDGIVSCDGCGFDLSMADRMFGMPPHVSPGVSDPVKLLTKSQIEKVQARIEEFHRTFPQVTLGLVIHRLPAEAPLRPYMFWLSERAQVFPQTASGSDARGVMVLFDAENGRLGLLPGYALEDLLTEQDFHAALAHGDRAFSKGQIVKGFAAVIDGVEKMLKTAWDRVGEVYGIPQEEIDAIQNEGSRTTSRQHIALAERGGWGMF